MNDYSGLRRLCANLFGKEAKLCSTPKFRKRGDSPPKKKTSLLVGTPVQHSRRTVDWLPFCNGES